MTPWSKPYYGITHLGTGPHRVTVTDRGSFAELDRWFPGCGFRPMESDHESAEAAKAAGEKWLREVA